MLKCHLPTWFILSDWGILDKLYQPVSIHFRTSGGYHVGVLSFATCYLLFPIQLIPAILFLKKGKSMKKAIFFTFSAIGISMFMTGCGGIPEVSVSMPSGSNECSSVDKKLAKVNNFIARVSGMMHRRLKNILLPCQRMKSRIAVIRQECSKTRRGEKIRLWHSSVHWAVLSLKSRLTVFSFTG